MKKTVFAFALLSISILTFGQDPASAPSLESMGKISSIHQLAMDSLGNIYATSPSTNRIYMWKRKDSTSYYKPQIWADELDQPTGLVIGKNALYVADKNQITAFEATGRRRVTALPPNPFSPFPYLSIDSTESLLIGLAVNCVHCIADPPYGSLQRVNPETGEREMLAQGFRIPTGIAIDPVTNRIWVADQAQPTEKTPRPGDELNVLEREKMHFGYPFCHSGYQPDALLGNKKSCELFFEPRIVLEDPARIAGIAFDPNRENHNLWVCTLGNGRDIPGRLLWFSLDEMREPTDAEDITPANAPKNFSPSDILMSPIGLVIADAKNGELWLLK
ncbi:MAG: hypothetical protein SchgKO_14860 [Schleiferiaceae bacterium]